jgi:hypothetical protein
MLRRLVIVTLFAAAALSAAPAHAIHFCAYTTGGAEETPKLPNGVGMPYQVCLTLPVDPPPPGS